jgi:hypothetical protein
MSNFCCLSEVVNGQSGEDRFGADEVEGVFCLGTGPGRAVAACFLVCVLHVPPAAAAAGRCLAVAVVFLRLSIVKELRKVKPLIQKDLTTFS